MDVLFFILCVSLSYQTKFSSAVSDLVYDAYVKIPTTNSTVFYLVKIIIDVHCAVKLKEEKRNTLTVTMNNCHNEDSDDIISSHQRKTPQKRIFQAPQYPQHLMHRTRAGMPQLETEMQRDVYRKLIANSITINTEANRNIQYVSVSNESARSHTVIPSKLPSNHQNIYAVTQKKREFVPSTSSGESKYALISRAQTIANYKFKKLPFYDVLEDIIKPIVLDGSERCTLPKTSKGMRECTFNYTMSPKETTIVAMNRDIFSGKNEYVYQCQIRICQLELEESGEVTDYLPIGLHIRVGNKACPLPPFARRKNSKTAPRRLATPINCFQFHQLDSCISNSITINWIPDEKKYALAMYIVKESTVDTLIKELQDKKSRNSEETKNYIIKHLADVDPDFATISYHFSLVCPLSTVRMKMPAKSVHCDHLQCFDVGTFILMNKINPTWKCPTCKKSCLYDDIRIENYFLEIVTSPTLKDETTEIEIFADGSWDIYQKNKDTEILNSSFDTELKSIDFIDLKDSDDEISIKYKPGGSKCQESKNIKPCLIDLTIDEDEEPPKQKRKLVKGQAADAQQTVGKVKLALIKEE